MVSATVAISDFMLMLVTSSLWVAGGLLCAGVLGIGTIGGLAIMARHWWRTR